MRYEVQDLGARYRLTAAGHVVRQLEDQLGAAGRVEWLTLTDRERTAWAELLLNRPLEGATPMNRRQPPE